MNGVRHERLPKPNVMLALMRHLVEAGVPPEKIADASPSRCERIIRSADRALGGPAFVARVSEQIMQQGKTFDPDRYFCETEQLMHVGGRTYAVTNQGVQALRKPSTLY